MLLHNVTMYLAYLDPSTGSIVVQAVIGAVAGVSVFGRRVIMSRVHKLRALLARKDNGAKKGGSSSTSE